MMRFRSGAIPQPVQPALGHVAWWLRQLLQPPRDLLQRIQRGSLLICLIIIVLLLQTLLLADTLPVLSQLLAGAGLLWLASHWLRLYRLPCGLLWEIAEGLALVLVGLLIIPLSHASWLLYLGLLYSGLTYRTLGKRGWRVLIRALVYQLACVGGFLLAPSLLDRGQAALLSIGQTPGFFALAGIAYALSTALRRQRRESARHQALAHAGANLMTALETERIAAAAHEAATVLVAGAPGTQIRVALGNAGGLTIAGDAPDDRRPIDLAALPTAIHDRLLRGETVTIDGAEAEPLRAALGFEPTTQTIIVAPLLVKDALCGLLAAGGESLPRHCQEGLQVLGGQVRLALDRAALASDLRDREATFRHLVQHSSDAISVVGEDMQICFVTPAMESLLDLSHDEMLGLKLSDLVHPDDLSAAISRWYALVEQPGASAAIEWRWRRRDGAWSPVETIATNLLHDAHIQGIVLTSRDQSRRKLLEEQLMHQAYHDPLTGLANRARFMERLEQALARPAYLSNSLAIMFLDLDRFKVVNDSLGHDAGDRLLTTVAERLNACLRPGDIVARLGGDEFAFLLDDVVDAATAIRTAERVLEQMHEPIAIDRHEIVVTTSIGITTGNAGRDRAEDLLRQADIAMYEAKRQGRACFMVFHPGMAPDLMRRLDLESDLHRAVKNDEFVLHYQPLVSLKTGRVTEVEALIRWRRPERGLLAPAEFIGLAEETGLIVPIGRWVLQTACRQVQSWHAEHPAAPPLLLSVNLSARQFKQPGLVAEVAHILRTTELDPACLKLEITESMALEDEATTIATLQGLKKLGVRLAIDDFGAGYSALGVLKRYPVDALKIDRSFVAGLGQDIGDTAIVRAVITFSRTLGLTVTAEGIETAEQLRQLRMLACDHGQGFFFARPLAWEELRPLLIARHAGRAAGAPSEDEPRQQAG